MDFSAELRKTYLAATPHTFVTAFIWIASGLVGQFASKSVAILMFIVLCSFIFPLGEVFRRIFKAPNVMSKENKLGQLFTLLAFTIPMSYPLIYLACRNNIDFFFPAFTILVGAHYLPFIYGYGMKSFGFLSVTLVMVGSLCSWIYPTIFSLSAYVTGFIMIAFAVFHYNQVKKEL